MSDSLYDLDKEHEKRFLGEFDSALFESESVAVDVTKTPSAPKDPSFDIQAIAKDVTELETHLHERHETVLTELDISCIQSELDRLNNKLKTEGKRRKMTNGDAKPVMDLFRKASNLVKIGEDARKSLRGRQGLPPLLSAGSLAESDDSDEEEIVAADEPDFGGAVLSDQRTIGGELSLNFSDDSSPKLNLARFTSEFLGGDYDVDNMAKDITYEFVPADNTEHKPLGSVDSPSKLLFKEASIAAGLNDEKNLVDYLGVMDSNVPTEMEMHLEPQVSHRKKPFCPGDLTPLQVTRPPQRSTQTSDSNADSYRKCESTEPFGMTPSLDTCSNSTSVDTHWEAPDIADYQLTPSAMDSVKSPMSNFSFQNGLAETPMTSIPLAAEVLSDSRNTGPLPTVIQSDSPINTDVEVKKVSNAYEAAAARAEQRKQEDKERQEKLLLNQEAVSVPIRKAPAKIDVRAKSYTVGGGDNEPKIQINWGGFLTPSPIKESVGKSPDSDNLATINWGGFLSPTEDSIMKEIPLPVRTTETRKKVDASEGYKPAVQVVAKEQAIMPKSILPEKAEKKVKPQPKPKAKRPDEGGGMVMLQREKKKKKQEIDPPGEAIMAAPAASAPPAEILDNVQKVMKEQRLSARDIKKLIGIQSDEELVPGEVGEQSLHQPVAGEITESEINRNIDKRVRKNAISPPAQKEKQFDIPAPAKAVAKPQEPVGEVQDPNNIPAHFLRLSEITSMNFEQLFEYYVSTGLPLVAFTKEDVLAKICKYNKVRPEREEEELEIPAFVNLIPSSIGGVPGATRPPVQKQKKQPKAAVKDGLFPMRAAMAQGELGAPVGEQKAKVEKTDSDLARELHQLELDELNELAELNELDANYIESKKRAPEIGGEGDHATMRKLEQAASFTNGEFRPGEKVRTKVVGNKGEVWIEAEVFDYNDEDDTWNVRVCEPEKYKVMPMAVHVPRDLLEKIVKDEHMAQLFAMGFDEKVAYQTLEAAHGNLEFALSLLVENKQQIPQQLRPSKVSHLRFGELPSIKGKKGGAPSREEFDYEVEFTEKKYGFEIMKGKDGRNAMVGTRVSPFSKINVHQGSLIVSIQGEFCVGMRLKKIRKLMIKAAANPPVVIRFRAKKWMRETSKKHGTLKILVVGAQALYKGATHATVRVHEALLTTDRVKKDENPFWNEMMVWKQYHPKRSQHAILKVWSYNRFTSNTCVGKAKVRLPHKFEKLEEQLVQVHNNNNQVVGLVMLRTVVSRNPYLRLG